MFRVIIHICSKMTLLQINFSWGSNATKLVRYSNLWCRKIKLPWGFSMMKMARRAKTTKQHNISLRMATNFGVHIYTYVLHNQVIWITYIADQGTLPPSNFRWAQTGRNILDSYGRLFVWCPWQGYPSCHNQEPSDSTHWVTPAWWRRDIASYMNMAGS
jgi:hypothetical protein